MPRSSSCARASASSWRRSAARSRSPTSRGRPRRPSGAVGVHLPRGPTRPRLRPPADAGRAQVDACHELWGGALVAVAVRADDLAAAGLAAASATSPRPLADVRVVAVTADGAARLPDRGDGRRRPARARAPRTTAGTRLLDRFGLGPARRGRGQRARGCSRACSGCSATDLERALNERARCTSARRSSRASSYRLAYHVVRESSGDGGRLPPAGRRRDGRLRAEPPRGATTRRCVSSCRVRGRGRARPAARGPARASRTWPSTRSRCARSSGSRPRRSSTSTCAR